MFDLINCKGMAFVSWNMVVELQNKIIKQDTCVTTLTQHNIWLNVMYTESHKRVCEFQRHINPILVEC